MDTQVMIHELPVRKINFEGNGWEYKVKGH
jgi:hypothetical protein